MNLYLLRHGEAEASASTSAGRQLTEAGHLEIASVAMQFASKRLEIDACFVSPALRAKQTAETFLSHIFNSPEPSIIDELSANQRAASLMHFLEQISANNVLLVSHNPILPELLAQLTRGNVDDLVILATGDLACVSLEVIGLGMGTCPFILQASASIPAS
jgi:phosphohistidine phosphatase SixA